MIVQEALLKKLRAAFDLNIYEVKIWTALLSRGVATAGELSDTSNVPRSRSYDVLESLEKKGFVVMKLGKPIKYMAIKPEEILRRVKNQIKNIAEMRADMIDKVKTDPIFKELELLYKQGIEHVEPANLSGAIKGRNNLYDHLSMLINNAQKSILMVTTPEGFIRKAKLFKQKFKKLADKGVKIKIATQVNDEVKKVAKELNGSIQLKPLSKLRSRFAIIDSKDVLFMVIDDDKVHETYDTGIWVSSEFFALALEQMFNVNTRG
jgi:sugar-specific transcriptional regulator TrmB